MIKSVYEKLVAPQQLLRRWTWAMTASSFIHFVGLSASRHSLGDYFPKHPRMTDSAPKDQSSSSSNSQLSVAVAFQLWGITISKEVLLMLK